MSNNSNQDSIDSKVSESHIPMTKTMFNVALCGTGLYALGTAIAHVCYPESKEFVSFMDRLLLCGIGYTTGVGLTGGLIKLVEKNGSYLDL